MNRKFNKTENNEKAKLKEQSLSYHKNPIPGKLSISPTKSCENQNDLSLAYTPGVAIPCLEIEKDESMSYEYTSRGNLVGVITDGSAVLGLGNIGASAGKPVMEGKSILFKKFAGIDAFDIELNENDPQKLIEIITAMEPTFGGINLEDISSPRCFEIEEALKEKMNIPVFHDDQHGTAVIAAAGLLNGLEINGKNIKNIKVAMSGAGAASVAIARHLINLGLPEENIFCTDSRGVLFEGCGRDKSPYHQFLYRQTKDRTLADIMNGADVFLGLSIANIVSEEMVKSMGKDPIILPMANPDPEIPYEQVKNARPDAIVGTGRSDFPNQVNNVLGFPAIFRGALDIRARAITDKMKIAATKALAKVARMPVPKEVLRAYGLEDIKFGPDYIIPKPFDLRVLLEEASAVAEAGIEEKVNRINLDIEKYREDLKRNYSIEY